MKVLHDSIFSFARQEKNLCKNFILLNKEFITEVSLNYGHRFLIDPEVDETGFRFHNKIDSIDFTEEGFNGAIFMILSPEKINKEKYLLSIQGGVKTNYLYIHFNEKASIRSHLTVNRVNVRALL